MKTAQQVTKSVKHSIFNIKMFKELDKERRRKAAYKHYKELVAFLHAIS